jgi:hypothetical protein
LNVTVSDCHFKHTVARCTEGNQVLWAVGLVLILKVSASFDMVDVQTATTRATLCAAVLAYLISAAYVFANSLPVATVGQFLTAPIVWTILASHKLNGAPTRAEAATVFGCALERPKGFTAVLAVQIDRVFTAFVSAFCRAMADCWRFLIEPLATYSTIGIGHPGTTPSKMALTRAEMLFPFHAVGLALKLFSAVIARQCNRFAQGINCALA